MSEPEEVATPSLIQQRMALQRQRTWAIVLLVVWGLSGVWWIASGLLDDEFDVMRVILGVVFIGLAVAQVFVIRKHGQATRAFEAAHGRDAGRQRS